MHSIHRLKRGLVAAAFLLVALPAAAPARLVRSSPARVEVVVTTRGGAERRAWAVLVRPPRPPDVVTEPTAGPVEVKNDAPLVSLATVVAKAVEEDLAVYLRLPELAISSAVADIVAWSAIADIDASEAVPAMTGRDNGARISPAITEIASRRPMSRRRFMF